MPVVSKRLRAAVLRRVLQPCDVPIALERVFEGRDTDIIANIFSKFTLSAIGAPPSHFTRCTVRSTLCVILVGVLSTRSVVR